MTLTGVSTSLIDILLLQNQNMSNYKTIKLLAAAYTSNYKKEITMYGTAHLQGNVYT